jgi:hypothetical protein
LEVSVTNGWFLFHAPRPPVEAPLELAAQVAPSHGSCRGVVEAA